MEGLTLSNGDVIIDVVKRECGGLWWWSLAEEIVVAAHGREITRVFGWRLKMIMT